MGETSDTLTQACAINSGIILADGGMNTRYIYTS